MFVFGISVPMSFGYTLLAAATGGYVLTSILLLNYPELLHKKKKKSFHSAHISHRGGAAENLENTLTAYHHAIKSGSQMLELDVNLSKDNQVVVSHDEDLNRCTGNTGRIGDFDYKDLPPLKKAIEVTFYKSVTCRYEGEDVKMPTLEDVFQEFPSTPINVDLKGKEEVLMKKSCELIEKYNREKITVWGSQLDSTCQKLYKMNPNIPMFFSKRRALLLYFWFYTGLLPFIPLKETHFEIILPDIAKHSDFSKSRVVSLLLFGWLVKSKALISHLKKRGIPTYFWVLNDEKCFETAFKLGAEGVMTDCPTKLTKWLDDNHQYWKNKSLD